MIGLCGGCGNDTKICDRCRRCDDCHTDGLFHDLENASPDQMNEMTQRLSKRGGKFALLAGLIMGTISADDPQWDKYKPGDSLDDS